ncbi:hypothetical protein AMQ84_01960 [Paenibacillus riograndensis]|uniref:Uncharacterized protein n=1 Tax=Paenibacillus riograndensis TaxID=483937 RepID=A0A132UBF5_9BACL|nr:hypothetical protein AMQ84_01960 [Paenibacillus riograndensis]
MKSKIKCPLCNNEAIQMGDIMSVYRLEKFTTRYMVPDSLSCAYKNDSRINDDEISFLPMRLAIDDGNNGGKKAAERYLKRLRCSI